MLSAEKLLSINSPELLFTQENLKSEYRNLVFHWHPDKNNHPDASDVFNHINKLYKQGIESIRNGCWDIPFFESIKDIDGKRYNIKCRYQFTFELGRCLVCDNNVVYIIDKSYKKFFSNFVNVVSNFSYPSDRVRDEISRFLPSINVNTETDDCYILVIPKSNEIIPLRVMYDFFDKKVDPKHVAWIIGCLYNLSCYFEVSGITHNDINIDNCFVSPKDHTIHLYGGWWYSVPNKTKMLGTSAKSFGFMTDRQRKDKIGNHFFDRSLMNSVALELLGDISGSSLIMDKNIPKSMLNWLTIPNKYTNIKHYDIWMNKILIDSFGERKFIRIDESIEEMYNKINN